MLVRGRDEYGHFTPDVPPTEDFLPDAIRHYLQANERVNAILYKGVAQNSG
jgi:hypothetical protein